MFANMIHEMTLPIRNIDLSWSSSSVSSSFQLPIAILSLQGSSLPVHEQGFV